MGIIIFVGLTYDTQTHVYSLGYAMLSLGRNPYLFWIGYDCERLKYKSPSLPLKNMKIPILS